MEQIQHLLVTFKRKTIMLTELEEMLMAHYSSYDLFAEKVLELEQSLVLMMVKSKGRNSRQPSLAFQYRINKNILMKDFHVELQHYRRKLDPLINLDYYYGKDRSVWEADLPYLLKINQYITTNPKPKSPVPAPERSYQLVGDEKWIIEKGGKELLERIGIFDQLQIMSVSEPLMFAINPDFIHADQQCHLIVENKATYQGLLPALTKTNFSTLIYGSGKAIIGSINEFSTQYPVSAKHRFFYFGDLDREGISIWHLLTNKQRVELALPFYQACLKKEPVTGKGYQRKQPEAVNAFTSNFSNQIAHYIERFLANGLYLPQETLGTEELQLIWRDSDWTSMTSMK
ncbi:MAG TPA: hypothetical protein GXZ58_05800 [Bacilli bacterium]|nr:hypothetical protein [Bacilli bacterium]